MSASRVLLIHPVTSGAAQVMEALVKLLADTKRPLRFTAAKSLAMLGDDTWEQACQHQPLRGVHLLSPCSLHSLDAL